MRGKIRRVSHKRRPKIRRKLSRINGTLRRNLAKTRLIEEQVLSAVLK